MFLLVPAAVVALATFLRGLLLLRGHDVAHIDKVVVKTESDAVAIRPLLWIYALAPLVGAAGTLSRLVNLSAEPGSDVLYVPMLWGVGLALFAGSVYYGLLLRVRRSPGRSEAGRGVLILPGLVALVAAFVICGFGHSALQRQSQNSPLSADPTLHVRRASPGGYASGEAPVLQVRAGGYSVDGQFVAPDDILFRLTAMATRTEAIIIQIAGDLTAQRMADALALVNQAGFVHVGVDATAD